jgi:hypothetical protein
MRLRSTDRAYRAGAGSGAASGDPDTAARKAQARRNAAVIVIFATAAFLMLLAQSLADHRLSGIYEYDDGVYFGSALALAHGIGPYRDYAFIQPPMISVLLLPFAWLSSATGTAVGMESARIFTDVVTTANVALAGLLVRHKSTLRVTALAYALIAGLGVLQDGPGHPMRPACGHSQAGRWCPRGLGDG